MMLFFSLALIVIFTGFYLLTTEKIHDLKSRYDALPDQAKGRVKSAEVLITAEAKLQKLHRAQPLSEYPQDDNRK